MPPPSEALRTKLRQQIDFLNTRTNKQLKLEQGRNTLRFCPSWKEDGEFYYMYMCHYNVTPELKWMVCPQTVGRECQVCELVKEYSEGGSEDQNRARAMRQTINYATNAILVARENRRVKDPSVNIFNMPVSVFRYLSSMLMEGDVDDFTDPREGYDIHITKTGEKLQTTYTVVPARGISPIPVKDWKRQITNLELEYKPKTDDEIYKMLGGRPRTAQRDSRTHGGERPSQQSHRPTNRPQLHGGERTVRRPRQEEAEEDDIPF